MGRLRAVLLACVLVSPAAAQPTKPTEAQMTQAKDLVNKAKDKSNAGDHQAAIDFYLAAYNIAPLPLLLSNVATEYEQLKKPVEALKYYCKYLEAEPDGPMASYATSHAKELQSGLHNPVDDKNVCAPPRAVPPPTPPDGAGSGSSATGSPGAGSDATKQQTGTTAQEDPGAGMKKVGLYTGVAGVVVLGAGTFFGVRAYQLSNTITDHTMGTKWENNINTEESDGRRDQTLQIVLMATGGAATVAGAVIYYLGRNKSETEHVAVHPVVAPGYGGFAAVGHF